MKVIYAFLVILLGGCYSGKQQDTYIDTFTIQSGILYPNVKVVITPDTSKALLYIKEIYSDATKEDLNSDGTTFPISEGQPIVIYLSTNEPGVVVHELLHSTISILKSSGIPLIDSTEEVYAYQLQYYYNEFYKHVKYVRQINRPLNIPMGKN